MKLKTTKLPNDTLPAVTISEGRWDNLDPLGDMASIFKEYLGDLDTIEADLAQLKARIKGRQAARADLRKILSGKIQIEVAEIDNAVRLARMPDEERALAANREYRALALACNALGKGVPAIQMDMNELWTDAFKDVPVADNGIATAV